MKKEKTTTKTVEVSTVPQPIQDDFTVPPMPKVERSNNHGAQNFTQKKKKDTRPSLYKLSRHGGKDKTGRPMYPVVYMLKSEDIVFDPEKDVNRKIRYIPGEVSIFEDEQKKDAKVKSPITFSNGFLMVDHTNPTLKKYLDTCNANGDNENRSKGSKIVFKLVNKEGDAKKHIKKVMAELDAIKTALEMPLDKLIGYARTLGVNVDKSTDEIRYDMKVLAEKDPVSFITGMDDPKTEIKQIIFKAAEYKIIDMNKSNIAWIRGDQRNIITHVPLGVQPIDHIAEFCLSGKGEDALEHIRLQLSNFS